jgi:PAS domain S-box-containing protein
MMGVHIGEFCYKAYAKRQGICGGCPVAFTFKDGKAHTVQRELQTDKEIRYAEITASPLKDSTGKIIAGIEVVRDITEMKREQKALQETEQKLRNIIEHSNELYYVHDTNHILSYASPQSLQVLGYTPDEMMIEWTRLATDNPINEKGVEITEKALKTGEKQGLYLLELYKKDRSRVLLEIDESPLKDEQGNVIGIVGAARDVTERVKAEEALKKSEKKIHMLLDSTAEGIYGIDLEGNCTFVNAACLRILGYDDENEIIGKNMHDLIHYKHPDGSPYPAEECKIFQTHKENKRIHDDTEVFWHKGGSSFPIEYRSFPIEEQGAVIGAVITFLDITERKQEEELEDMRTEQKLLNKEALLQLMKTNIQDPEELWKFMTLMGSQILGLDRVSIWFINNMHSEFICDALYVLTKHSHEKGLKIQVKHCPQYVVALSENRILPKENALVDKRTIELSEDYLRPFGIISKMDVPVIRLGEVIGIISFEHTKERVWTYEDQDFAISLSHLITASLENFDRTRAEKSLRNSEKELKKRVKELEEFYEMAVGRELRIRDLKEEVEELKEELAKYKK